MKVAKEEIVGLIKSLEIFVNEDEEAEMERYRRMCGRVVDALIEIPGLKVTVEHDDYDYLIPHAVMKFTKDRKGAGRNEVRDALAAGDPPIYMHDIHNPDELAVDPFNIDDDELEIVIRRLREELLK
jgi:seryl-tRNA(Sec) selenium transferase